MKIILGKTPLRNDDVDHIERISGEDSAQCYQCGNCSAGCPVSYAMDIPPSQIVRFLQLGMVEEVMAANTMWLCVGCLQCYSRCPKCVSVANLLEAMRAVSLRIKGDHDDVEDLPSPFLVKAPQQAIVSGFRKFVS